jgi:hypothetical protein
MATFSEILHTAVRAATHQVSEGSRRNARLALEARADRLRESAEILAALPTQRGAATAVRDRRSA